MLEQILPALELLLPYLAQLAPLIAKVPLVLHALLLVLATYTFFLAYCAMRVAQKNGKFAAMPWPPKALCGIILLTGLACDALLNVTLGSLVFWEAPTFGKKEILLTWRLKQHRTDLGWQGDFARWVCEGWLNPFDAGHC